MTEDGPTTGRAADPRVTRLAPSPTGALHLGNARTFLINHLLAVCGGWRVVLRVEDLDGPRVKRRAADAMLDELAWLGLSWSGPAVYQSARHGAYLAALRRLVEGGWAYPCTCSRKDVQLAASAPHAEDAAGAYPGTCRPKNANVAAGAAPGALAASLPEGWPPQWPVPSSESFRPSRRPAWRVRVPDGPVAFDDRFAGPQSFDLARTCGDFVVFKNDGLAAYQLAVVVDDCGAGVDAVVRGDDLLESAARQIHLRRLLGLGPQPQYWHLPLVVGPDGRRLAKRHGDTRLGRYRALGVRPQRILGLLGFWSGLLDTRREAPMEELAERFDTSRIPPRPVVFSAEDEAFLAGGRR